MLDCSIHYETLESPLDCKEIKPVSFKGNRSWIFIWKALLKLKRQSFGHLIQNANSLEKTLMLGKIEEEKGTTEEEMFGWHHQLNGHEFEQALGVDGQRSWWTTAHGVAKSQTQLSNWKTIYIMKNLLSLAHILNTQSLWQPKLLPKFTTRSLGWFRNRHMTLHTITVQSEESLDLLFDNGEGDGTPLQYSCLENPMDGGAW